MKQFRKDMAALAEPAFWVTIGLLLLPYALGTVLLVWTCGCL
ncbi:MULTISPECIES: hypothetical protein [Mesorhizobium]|nr:hypothetical protein [Mesorhizobium sp.]